jgi:hypothetical protein
MEGQFNYYNACRHKNKKLKAGSYRGSGQSILSTFTRNYIFKFRNLLLYDAQELTLSTGALFQHPGFF